MHVENLPASNTNQNIPHSPNTPENLAPTRPLLEAFISDNLFNHDTLFISDAAKELLLKDKDLINIKEKSHEVKELLKQLGESSSAKNSNNDGIKYRQIAMGIISGDNVPNKDKIFLAENRPEIYLNALLLAQKNNHPKKYTSILQDEKDSPTIRVIKSLVIVFILSSLLIKFILS